jgi:hypothetical protein
MADWPVLALAATGAVVMGGSSPDPENGPRSHTALSQTPGSWIAEARLLVGAVIHVHECSWA